MMSERWLYSVSIPFCCGVGWGWNAWTTRIRLSRRRLPHLFGIALLAALALRTGLAIKVWKSDFTLFRTVLSDNPRLPRAHLWLADAYLQADSLDSAETHYRLALALAPDDPLIHGDLGIFYSHRGNCEQAIREFHTALLLGGEQPNPRLNLGVTYQRMNRFPEALVEYGKALALGAEPSRTYYRMGECYLELGDTLRAKEAFKNSLSADPSFSGDRKKLKNL